MGDTFWTILKLLSVAVLVLLNAFFVASEFALVKARRTRIRQWADEGRFGARLTLQLMDDMNAYLSAAQLGVTMTSLGLGWLGEQALAHIFLFLFHPFDLTPVFVHIASATLVFALITFLHIVIGEQAPKVLAIQMAEATSVWIAWPLRIFHMLIYPAIWILNTSSLGVLKLLGLQPAGGQEVAHSAEELRSLLQQSSKTSQLTPVAGSLLLNALDLRRRKARQVMLHRTKIIFLSTRRTIAENLKIARQSNHSRYPLCDGNIDQIVGMVHLKDMMWLVHDQGEQANLASIKRDVLFVPETMPLERLLSMFLKRRVHLAVLVDEYGTVVGMVTLENILEEIVGDIQDEFDQEALMFQKLPNGEFRLHGELPLHDLEELLGIHLSAEDVTTIGGYLVKEFGHVPQTGESRVAEGHEFIVLRTTGRQVVQIGVKRLQHAEFEV